MHFSTKTLQLTTMLFGSFFFVAAIDPIGSSSSEPIILKIKPAIDGSYTFTLPLQIESTPHRSDSDDIRQIRSGTLSFGTEHVLKSVSFTGGPMDADYPVCFLIEAPLTEDGTIDFAGAGEGGGIQPPFTVGEIARSDRATGVLCKAYYINYN